MPARHPPVRLRLSRLRRTSWQPTHAPTSASRSYICISTNSRRMRRQRSIVPPIRRSLIDRSRSTQLGTVVYRSSPRTRICHNTTRRISRPVFRARVHRCWIRPSTGPRIHAFSIAHVCAGVDSRRRQPRCIPRPRALTGCIRRGRYDARRKRARLVRVTPRSTHPSTNASIISLLDLGKSSVLRRQVRARRAGTGGRRTVVEVGYAEVLVLTHGRKERVSCCRGGWVCPRMALAGVRLAGSREA